MPNGQSASRSGTAEQDARLALARALASPGFSGSVRLQRFLTYIVNEALAGRGNRIKALAIAEAVYDKNVVEAPGSDGLVRSEATRLRRVLSEYYAGPGADDPVKIAIPRGTYVPEFIYANTVVSDGKGELHPPARDTQNWWIAGAAAAFAAVVVLAAVFLLQPRPVEKHQSVAEDGPPLIAVLPFTVAADSAPISGSGFGLAQEIAVHLSRFETGLVYSPVVSATDSSSAVIPRLKSMGARYALMGTIRQSANNTHVVVQLIDLKQNTTAWAQTYDRAMTANDLANIQSDIGRDIAITLGQPYGIIVSRQSALVPMGGQKIPAYECVIGIYGYMRTLDESLRKQIHACLERTIAEKPDYSSAWAGLAILDSATVLEHYMSPAELAAALDKALDDANTAVARAPQSAFAHQALADVQFRRGDMAAFEISAKEAMALNPDDPQMLVDFGYKYYCLGHYDEGLSLINQGIGESPVPPARYYRTLFLDAFRKGRQDDASSALDAIGSRRSISTLAFRVMVTADGKNVSAKKAAVGALFAADPNFVQHANYYFAQWRLGPDVTALALKALATAGLNVPAETASHL